MDMMKSIITNEAKIVNERDDCNEIKSMKPGRPQI